METSKTDFHLTRKQREALSVIVCHQETLLSGGARAGKSLLAIYTQIFRALKYPKTKHASCRLHLNHIRASLCNDTMIKTLELAFPGVPYQFNKSDLVLDFENGSQLMFFGLDDKQRTEKILGTEFDTLFLNEASQLSYSAYEMVKTRLNPRPGVSGKILIDYNPPSSLHWGYKIFMQGVNPETGQKLLHPERYGAINMNPHDNMENLSPDYIQNLESMSEAKRNRFLYGRYSDASEFALWKPEWIIANRWSDPLPNLVRVVIGVDPAVSGGEKSDDTGIIVAGCGMVAGVKHFFILDDLTYHGDVTGWGQMVANAFNDAKADCVVAEVNQGGDLVEMNIRNYNRNIPVRQVRATRGKAVRAEPIADLYRRGLVHHVKELPDLETQMISWTPESDESPDNMDALVWALSFLAEINYSGQKLNFVIG